MYAPGITLVGNVATGVVLCYGGLRVIDGDIKVGVLATFLLYLGRFFDPLQDLSQFYNSFQSAAAALEKISGVLDEPPAVPEPPPVPCRRAAARPPRRGPRRAVRRGALRLPGLARAARPGPGHPGRADGRAGRRDRRGQDHHGPAAGPVLRSGPGQVLLDGVDLRDVADRELRREIVLVTQENFVFSGSVADNIALGRPGASRAEVEAAAQAIGAGRFIAALPGGFDADVGKRGGRLSAGQRQLISFARAFLAAPAVLILDEATSLLDIPSERTVQAALRTILAGRTAMIIAHRLSTVEIADRVLVLSAGQIVEDGPPGRLHDRRWRVLRAARRLAAEPGLKRAGPGHPNDAPAPQGGAGRRPPRAIR